jgi:hypothetical protein
MKNGLAVGCCLFLACLAAAEELHPVSPRASLHADCDLGPNADHFWVTVDRTSETETQIVFSPRGGRGGATSFVVHGVLAGFESLATDLVLHFESPGPTTRAYSEVNGKIVQLFECTSRFGAEAVPIGTKYGRALVCYQGEQMVGRLWLPTVAKIYLRGDKGYDLVAQVPYRRFFQTLGEINNRETHKLSGGAWEE